jgi:hypothetical protein
MNKLMRSVAIASLALCAHCSIAPTYSPPPTVACTGPWREVERASKQFGLTRFAHRAAFEGGTLWLSMRTNTMVPSGWDSWLVRADRWGAGPQLERVAFEPHSASALIDFQKTHRGWLAAHSGWFSGTNDLLALSSLRPQSTGVANIGSHRVAFTRDETLVLRSTDDGRSIVDRFRPMESGATGSARLIASANLPSTVTNETSSIHASNSGAAIFVLTPDATRTRTVVAAFDATLSRQGEDVALGEVIDLAVDDEGLWLAARSVVSNGSGPLTFEVTRVRNNGTALRLITEPAGTTSPVFRASLAARGDVFALCATRVRGDLTPSAVEVYNSSTGAVVQRMDDVCCESVAFSHDSLFVVQATNCGGHLNGNTVAVRRFACN